MLDDLRSHSINDDICSTDKEFLHKADLRVIEDLQSLILVGIYWGFGRELPPLQAAGIDPKRPAGGRQLWDY